MTKRSSQWRRYHSYANLKLLNGWRTPATATATLTGFLGLDWMLGPLSPALIRISPSESDLCSRTCFVTLWCNRLSNRDCWLLTHAPLFMVRVYCTRENLRPFTSSDETSWCWSTLIAVFQRGRVSSYQLSVFGFQIMAVFGRIRIVHLAHYSVRFGFESNIRYSPSRYYFAAGSFHTKKLCSRHFSTKVGCYWQKQQNRVLCHHLGDLG